MTATGKDGFALLVTGTDTDAGKTIVGSALVAAWRQRGFRVGVYKPVESGVEEFPLDATALRRAAGEIQTLDEVCPVRLKAPLAPPLAARLEGRTLDPADWERRIQALRPRFDLLLVEGAGGLLSPLWEGGDAAQLAQRTGLPTLVVAPDQLGVINHVRLTLEALQRREIPVLAVVLSRIAPGPGDPSCASNATEIARLCDVPVVGPLPFCEDLDPDGLARQLEACPGAGVLMPDGLLGG